MHGLALLGQSCVPKSFHGFFFSPPLNKSRLKMNSQEGSSMGGSACSLSLLIMLEICCALLFFLVDSSDTSEERMAHRVA